MILNIKLINDDNLPCSIALQVVNRSDYPDIIKYNGRYYSFRRIRNNWYCYNLSSFKELNK